MQILLHDSLHGWCIKQPASNSIQQAIHTHDTTQSEKLCLHISINYKCQCFVYIIHVYLLDPTKAWEGEAMFMFIARAPKKVHNRDLLTNQVLNGSLKAWQSPYSKFFNEHKSISDEKLWVSPLHTSTKNTIFLCFDVSFSTCMSFLISFMLCNYNLMVPCCYLTSKLN